MTLVKRLVLDILKPHQPNALDFAQAIAEQDTSYLVNLTVEAVDEKTESIVVTVSGDDVQFKSIEEIIKSMGGSIHSIDEVDVSGS